MRAKEHSRLILSRARNAIKRVGLHYIGFSESVVAGKEVVSTGDPKIAKINELVTNLG
jgi:hypothetical protein